MWRWLNQLMYVAYWKLIFRSKVSLLAVIKFSRNIRVGRRCTIRSGCMIDAPQPGVIELGDNVDLNRHVYLGGFGSRLHIGARSSINQHVFIDARGSVLIGEDVMIGPFARLVSYNHIFADLNVPMNTQGFALGEIRIGDDVWIGAGATILPGVTIGRGSIVAAGAVVTHSCPAGSILAGVPARIIRSRFENATGQ